MELIVCIAVVIGVILTALRFAYDVGKDVGARSRD